jgi:hypothetical protein
MEEEVIDYLYNWATSDGFKKSKEDFVKLLQTNDEVLSYAFDFAQKDGFKKDKNALGLLVGRTSTAAPVATAEPEKTEQTAPVVTTEPAKTETVTEPAKTEPTTPIATPPVATETVATTEPATTAPVAETKLTVTPEPEKMQVKSVEATPAKEEPMTAEKKEAVKSDIESQLLPVTEKTEVKAIETPSDKMVIKSEAKVEPKLVEGKSPFDIDEDMNLFIISGDKKEAEKVKELSKQTKAIDLPLEKKVDIFLNKSEGAIELDRNISLSFPDPPNVKKKTEATQNTENIFEDKIDNKNVYSYYDQKNDKWYIYNKERDENNWNEVTSPQIKTVLNTKYKNNSGEIDKSKIFKIEESEANQISDIKMYYFYNKYIPEILKNWDKLNETQQNKARGILKMVTGKRLGRDMYFQEEHKEKIKELKDKIERGEAVDEMDEIFYFNAGNPDKRYDIFWENAIEKAKIGDDYLKNKIKKYKK